MAQGYSENENRFKTDLLEPPLVAGWSVVPGGFGPKTHDDFISNGLSLDLLLPAGM